VSDQRFSLAGRMSALFGLILLIMAALAAAATLLPLTPWEIFLLVLLVGIPLGVWWVHLILRPLRRTLAGVTDGIRSFHDHDFSVRVAGGRKDELGELVDLYNEVGEILHQERKSVRQRELLLQAALDSSPMAIVLVNPLERVLYANVEARRLLLGGARLRGHNFRDVLERCPDEMRAVLASDHDGLFSVDDEGQVETYHLARRRFTLNQQPHSLYLLRRLTADLGRQEAEIWKKVIRTLSHELNNSLAPISSMAHSAQILARDPEKAERLSEVFSSIRQNTERLGQFLEGYARFARLPRPRRRRVDWESFVGSLQDLHHFDMAEALPREPGFFDPAHMQQVLTNLFKNAGEASDGKPEISLSIRADGTRGTFIEVRDRGRGIPTEVLRRALLPFYSTKKEGTGLGLPLCREIIEAHGGRIRIQAREGGGTTVTCWLPAGDGGSGR
jgi:two-component system nitrogen regulation sensor histidine kinase NtrY